MKLLQHLLWLLLVCGNVHADPSIWKVEGRHNAVYLLGTIHLLHADQVLPDNVQRIYRASTALWLEVDMAAVDPLATQVSLMQRGLLPEGKTLDALLDAPTRKQLAEAATHLGMSTETLAPMRPWLAALTLEMGQYLQQGFSPASGVEMQLIQQAERDGKTVHGLETMDQQLELFASLSSKAEIGFLQQTLQELDQSADEAATLEAAWLAGDDAAMAGYLATAMQQDAPLYHQLTTARNRRWVTELQSVLDNGDETTLVAVGALHLVGNQGLVALLRQAGYRVSRL